MPTVDNPRHFETGTQMDEFYDSFFKWASIDVEPDHQTGEVESPGGFVSLIYVEAPDEINEYLHYGSGHTSFEDEAKLSEGISTGWYVTLQDNNGIIWAFAFGDSTLAEEHARREFRGSELYYEQWLVTQDEQEPEVIPQKGEPNYLTYLPRAIHRSAKMIASGNREKLHGWRALTFQDRTGGIYGYQIITDKGIYEVDRNGVCVRASMLHGFEE